MPFWPFKKTKPASLTPVELRDKLVEVAGSGASRQLRSLCKQYKGQVAEHVDVICKLPNGMTTDDGSIDRYFQSLAAVAQCLAQECGAPELWNKLCGNPEDNPLVQWDHWFGELPDRMQRLEYDELIVEAEGFIEKAKTLKGGTARLNEAYLYGRLGELLFHSGRVDEALEPFQSALDLCVESKDVEGQIAYLNNLLEAHCYLDDGQVISTADRLLGVKQANGLPSEDVEKRLASLRKGEPLCRIVCVRDGHELELGEITDIGEGSYQFQFRRNRLSLHMAVTLTGQGNKLASTGQHSDALGKYHEANQVDPHDPDPVYQSGMCLLELGAYGKAREAFEDVGRLAPGWFRCRSDRWIASCLEDGTISVEEFMLVRTLDDGGLKPKQAVSLAKKGIERFPEFAPLYLFLGDHSKSEQDAVAAYRKGLALVEEPDLESRLLCALAGRLPSDSPERKELVERAVNLKGSLVAVATAKLMDLQ
ncbi:MAG: tetratricopeptide repeat protein [Planctomycetota bacterium]